MHKNNERTRTFLITFLYRLDIRYWTRLGIQQCQAQGLVFCSWSGLIPDRIRMCKFKGVILTGVWMLRTPVYIAIVCTTFAKHLALLNVIFPIKMTPVHEVWSWSLGGQGIILTVNWIFRTPASILWTTFAEHLALQNVLLLAKMTSVYEVWCWSLGGQRVILRLLEPSPTL